VPRQETQVAFGAASPQPCRESGEVHGGQALQQKEMVPPPQTRQEPWMDVSARRTVSSPHSTLVVVASVNQLYLLCSWAVLTVLELSSLLFT
jgi:hypothetical protein